MIPPVLPSTANESAPAVLMPYQQRWVADTSPLKVIEKGRRTGITWAEAADNVLTAAASTEAGGQNVYYVGYNQDMTLEYIEACAMWARAFDRLASEVEMGFWGGDDADKHIRIFTIRFPSSGHRIVALSSRPSNLRGRQGVIVIDEAAFHDKLGELLKAAMAMMIWGGKVHVISTHNGIVNPFAELVEDIRAGRRAGTVHRVSFSDAVGEGLYRRVCIRTRADWTPEGESAWVKEVYDFYSAGADEELDCIPSQSGGAWLSRALIESRMSAATPVLRWSCNDGFELLPDRTRESDCREWLDRNLAPLLADLDPGAMTFLGEDFGRSGDLTVLAPLVQQQNLTRRTPFVIELRNVPFRQQEQIVFYLLDNLPRFTGGCFDARGNGQYLAEVAMQRYGPLRIQQVMLTEAWYREHMPPLKAALEDGTLDGLPRDADILADLRAIEVVRGVARIPETRSAGADKGQRHGDAGVALALAWHASRELNHGPVVAASRNVRSSYRLTEGY